MEKLKQLAPFSLWANLISQIVIVVTGGLVRVTGSGLGCSTWPNCEPGAFTPVFHEETPYHAFIEFGNRTLTGVLLVFALMVAIGVFKDDTLSKPLRRSALLPLIGTATQGLIGAAVVLLHLHPATVGIHLLVSMWLIWISTRLLLQYRAEKTSGTSVTLRTPHWTFTALTVTLSVVLFLGMIVTGAGPHSGDENIASRFPVDPLLMSRIHAASVWVFLAVVLIVLMRVLRGIQPELRAGTLSVLVISLAQGALGYIQTFTGLPIALVNLHLLGAAVLTAVVAALVTRARVQYRANETSEERVRTSRA